MKIVTINPYQPSGFRLDFLAESIMEGLQKIPGTVTIISSDRCNDCGVVVDDDDELVEHAQDADYIFVIWDKKRLDKPEPKYHLLDKINAPEKTAFIDGAEWTYTAQQNPKPGQCDEALRDPSRRRGEPWIWREMHEKVKWHFKRECYPQDREEFGCIPLPFAAIDRYFRPSLEKKYSIQCSFGQVGTGLRAEVQDICHGLADEEIDDVLVGELHHEQYLTTMSEAYTVVDAWGGGDCNARFYEAVANGAVPFYQTYQILTPFPYLDGQCAITYSTPKEFKEKVFYYFYRNQRLDEIKRMAKISFNNTIHHHTSEKRVKYMIDVMNNKFNVDEVLR